MTGVISEGAAAAGRDPATQDIAAPLMVSVGTDATAAREAVKAGLAYYLYRVEKVVYAHSGADAGIIQKIREVTAERGPEAGAALVTDEIIDTFAVAGDTGLAIRRFREYADAAIRGLIIQHVPGPERVQGLTLIAERRSSRMSFDDTFSEDTEPQDNDPERYQAGLVQPGPATERPRVSRWGIWLHAVRPVPELVSLATAAEQLGAAALLLADEGIDRDLYVTLTAIAVAEDLSIPRDVNTAAGVARKLGAAGIALAATNVDEVEEQVAWARSVLAASADHQP